MLGNKKKENTISSLYQIYTLALPLTVPYYDMFLHVQRQLS